jgi:pimeloyl-ACP methyl ester carboxylesterase
MQEALVVGVGIAAARLQFRRLPLPPNPLPPHTGKVPVINYVKITGSAGAGAGSVVLLHGFGTGFAVWAQTLPV